MNHTIKTSLLAGSLIFKKTMATNTVAVASVKW